MGTFSFPTGGMNLNPTGTMGGNTNAFGIPNQTGGAGNFGFGNGMNPNPSGGNPYSAYGTPAGTTGTNPVAPIGVGIGGGSGGAQGPPGQTFMPAGVSSNPGGGLPPSQVTGENNQTSASNNPLGQTSRQQDRTLGELQTYYGEGVGSFLDQYLNTDAGYNSALTQQTIDASTNAMQRQIQLGGNNLESQLGAMGISANSSGQSVLGDYYSQATANENSIAAQDYYNMWNSSQQREENVLQSVAQVNATGTANQTTWMDYLNEAVGIAGDVATMGMSGAIGGALGGLGGGGGGGGIGDLGDLGTPGVNQM